MVESSITLALDRLSSVHGAIRHAVAPFPQEPRDILAQGYGQCTHFAALLVDALIADGVPARQFYLRFDGPNGDDSHVCVEAYLDGAWRFLDPTYHRHWMGGTVRELLAAPERVAEITQGPVSSGVEAYDPTDRYYSPAVWRHVRLVRVLNGEVGRRKPLQPYLTADYLRLAGEIDSACERSPNRWVALPSAGVSRDLQALYASFRSPDRDEGLSAVGLARLAWIAGWLAFQRVRRRG